MQQHIHAAYFLPGMDSRVPRSCVNIVTLQSQLQAQENPLQCVLNPSEEPGKPRSLEFVTLFISEILQIHTSLTAGFRESPALGGWVNSPPLLLLFQQHWSLRNKDPGSHHNFSFMQRWIYLDEYPGHLVIRNCGFPALSHTAGVTLVLAGECLGSLKYSFYYFASEKNTISTSNSVSDLSIPWTLFKSGAKQHLQHQWMYQLVTDDILSIILCGRLHFPIINFLLLFDYSLSSLCL